MGVNSLFSPKRSEDRSGIDLGHDAHKRNRL